MKKFLAIAAFMALVAAPVMAEDVAAPAVDSTIVVEEVTTITTDAAPEAAAEVIVEEVVTTTETTVDVEAATTACTAETNEKVKLPEAASEAEQAQWDAALAECLKGKGVSAE